MGFLLTNQKEMCMNDVNLTTFAGASTFLHIHFIPSHTFRKHFPWRKTGRLVVFFPRLAGELCSPTELRIPISKDWPIHPVFQAD